MTKEFTEQEINKIVKAVKNNPSISDDVIYLGNFLELKLVRDEETGNVEAIDIYRYADEELMEDDDYDFDSDFITTIYLK